MPTPTDTERSQRARIAALTRWTREDPGPNAARARAGLDAKFVREVDPNGSLSPEERARRIAVARKLYYTRLAYESAKARRRKAGAS